MSFADFARRKPMSPEVKQYAVYLRKSRADLDAEALWQGETLSRHRAALLELAQKNIRVNAVCPGMVETNILQAGTITEEQIEKDKHNYPLKRYGKPEDVAYAMIYLLSDASSWVTGTNLIIDGGYSIR